MRAPILRHRRWTRDEYDRLIDLGVFDEDRKDNKVELIEGRMIVAEPQNTPHAVALELAVDAVRAAFGAGWRFRVGAPMAMDPDSEPEPDLVVLRGTPRDSISAHPSTAALVIEIADSSLRFDRIVKGRVYASAGIADYWIVNVVDNQVEVYRNPEPDASQLYGYGYADRQVFHVGDTVSPLAAAHARIKVDSLLP